MATAPNPAPAYPACFDPYLILALEQGFDNFFSLKGTEHQLLLLVELKDNTPATRDGFDAAVTPLSGRHMVLGRYVCLRCERKLVEPPGVGGPDYWTTVWNKYVSRVELSLPVLPVKHGQELKAVEQAVSFALTKNETSKIWKLLKPLSQARAGAGLEANGGGAADKLLLGVIDDGCAFARQSLRTGGRSRILALWDQSDRDGVARVEDGIYFGLPCVRFGYGYEFLRDSKGAAVGAKPQFLGIDDWIALHTTAGLVNEDACYAEANFGNLKVRATHGTHVLDVLAGPIAPAARLGDSAHPPTWNKNKDAAAQADIVFVQIPKAGADDASGRWLGTHVMDGLQYILDQAIDHKATRVVVNISYGPTSGMHDGNSVLECAMREMVPRFEKQGCKLDIVLCAGNAYLSEGHVSAPLSGPIEWVWSIPPANSVRCFAEVWLPGDSDSSVSLISPADTSAGNTIKVAWGGSTCWLLSVKPTMIVGAKAGAALAGASGPGMHGQWKIQVTPGNNDKANKAIVHAYAARSDPNMGARTQAKRSYFIDPAWEKTRAASAAHCLNDVLARSEDGVKLVKDASLVRRDGTLVGIATGTHASIHVAGAYRLIDGRKARYCSAGPARGPLPVRTGPDFGLPCDQSYSLLGIRAAGTRSGGTFRMAGTSVGAPQLARHLANASTAASIPGSPPQTDTHGLGAGNLPAP